MSITKDSLRQSAQSAHCSSQHKTNDLTQCQRRENYKVFGHHGIHSGNADNKIAVVKFHFQYHISFTATKMNLVVYWHPRCITNNVMPVMTH